MTAYPGLGDRLRFLLDVVAAEQLLLAGTDSRLFDVPMDAGRVAGLQENVLLAERVDAFVARFGRLQDAIGDKLLPALLDWLGEPVGPVIDNLARAERWGWVQSVDGWLTLRQLRNRMVHEYIKQPHLLAQALNEAHGGVPVLLSTASAMRAEVSRRTGTAP